MTSDARAAQAREEHRLAGLAALAASAHRARRDRLIRQLRTEDPVLWTYTALAKAVGCSPELIAVVVKNQRST